ncbi:hypothetical protein EX30DRAFT_361547 [Ascodesmis nigricans]|uniref:Uncharacterized protein n=1 Tax=Ascodesmis nigricans TaxID=341454 RepID=A0A4V3SJC5_9PEZI|nr:hypothetical protein EX30DRAFT_361547 [Ascodesmis nigricans]
MYAHRQKLTIVGRPTKSVTIFASSAQVVREFDDIIIKPGINVYTITHLSPYADLSSFQVAGHGTTATILDTSAEVLQHARVSADSDSDSATPSSSDSSDDEFDRDSIIATLPAGQRRREIENELTAIRHSRASLDLEKTVFNKEIAGWEFLIQKLLDVCGGKEGAGHGEVFDAIQTCMESYRDVLGKAHSRFSEIMMQLQKNDTREQNLQRELGKIDKKLEKKLQSAYSRYETLRAKREMRKAEKNLKSGFPYTVLTITLEAKTIPDDTDTPQITATTDAGKPTRLADDTPPSDATAPTLRISYAVNYIHWLPRFHISLSTTTLTGELHYTAEIQNASREAFMDAEVALSTAHQQPWKHLGVRAPPLLQWRIGVGKDNGSNGIAKSKYEREKKGMLFIPTAGGWGEWVQSPQEWGKKPEKTTGCLFGRSKATHGAVAMGGLFGSAATTTPATGFGSAPTSTTVPAPTTGGGLFGAQPALNASNVAGTRTSLFGGFGSAVTAPTAPEAPAAESTDADDTGAGSEAAVTANASTTWGLFGSAKTAPGSTATGGVFGGVGGSSTAPTAPTSERLFGSAAIAPGSATTGFGSSPTAPAPTTGGLFGSAAAAPGSTTTGFGSSPTAPAPTTGGLFGQHSNPNPPPNPNPFTFTPAAPSTLPRAPSSPPPLPYDPTATFTTATSTTHTHGTTTTYTLGRKSLLSTLTTAFTTLPTTHHLSTTSLPSITLTHHITPKLSPFAFVNAFLPLPASAPYIPESTPLKLTVDHHVLGSIPAPAPLASLFPASRSILLPLGTDSNVAITYSAPDPETRTEGLVRTTRVFTHRREWRMRNNSTRKITVKVRDQLPVVDPEEKSVVSVTVLQPKGVQAIVEAWRRLDEWNRRVREVGGDVAKVKDARPVVGRRWVKVELPVGEGDVVASGASGESVSNSSLSSSSSSATSQEKEKQKQEDHGTETKNENHGTCEPVKGLDGAYDGVEWTWSVEAGGVRSGVLVWEVNTTGEKGAVVSLT